MTKKILTQARLKELLHYDPDTGLFTWKVYRGRKAKPGYRAGCFVGKRHTTILTGGRQYKAHRLAWLYVYGEYPPMEIDHINGDGHDNRIANLRSVTHAENMRNQKINVRNNSGVTGVGWRTVSRKWSAKIKYNGRDIHIGYFKDFDHAVIARKAAEKALGFHKNHGR